MIERKRFAVNRIACPSLSLEDFFALTVDLGLSKVELRNDLPGAAVIDGRQPAEVRELAERRGVRIISINALQKFNLKAVQERNKAELEKLLGLASALGCTAIVMCPNNDTQDKRDVPTRLEETVSALTAFGPLFTARGIQGWVEPLGFTESSLSSVVVAREAVTRSGFSCFRIVLDTFHHYLGPDTEKDIDATFASSLAGLIHVSGVEDAIPKASYRDAHRVLVSAADRMASRQTVARMVSLGYRGDIAFEPFSSAVQSMSRQTLEAALRTSIEFLSGE